MGLQMPEMEWESWLGWLLASFFSKNSFHTSVIGGLLTAPDAQARAAPGWLCWCEERVNPWHSSIPFSQRLLLFKPLLQLGKESRIILSSRRGHCMVSTYPDWDILL